MAEAWVPISDDEFQKAGETYRARIMSRLPFPQAVEPLKAALKLQASLNRDLETVRWDVIAPMATAHSGGALTPWTLLWTYKPRPAGSNVGVIQAGMLDPWIVGALIGLVIGTMASLALLSTRFEKLIVTVGEEVRRFAGVADDLFGALVPLAILVVVAMAISRKGG